jgi:flagellar basal-body rod protein FlgF
MESTSFLALSKQVALEMRLSNIANNLANASTPGYRRNEMAFEGFLSRQHASAPILYPVERGVRVDLGEGPVIATGNQLDLSITGNDRAFFVVARGNETFLTRAGTFQLDDSGQLATAAGDVVLGASGQPIVLPGRSATITVTGNGAVYEGEDLVGELQLVEVAPGASLDTRGDSRLTASATRPAEGYAIKQGVVEQSNVQSIIELTKLIQLSRDFEALQQIQASEHSRLTDVIERLPTV